MSPSFLDPPPDYAPPSDWVDPLSVEPPVRDEVEVGDLLKKRAEALRENANQDFRAFNDHPEEDCEPCRKKRARARAIGVSIGTFIGGAAVLAVVYLLKGHDADA